MKRAACLVVLTPNRKILAVTRRNSDQWSFPGGKVDPGETTTAAVARETFEETGISLNQGRLFPIDTEDYPGAGDYATSTFLYTEMTLDELCELENIEPYEYEPGIKVACIPVEEFLANNAFPEFNKTVLDTLL
jgi:8-oxo-dGTP pyrophosphatase MutT (NUDIX family)